MKTKILSPSEKGDLFNFLEQPVKKRPSSIIH